MDKISYVILTWNSETYIKSCLDSIFAIRNLQNNVIVVDNGSNDSTGKILMDYASTRQEKNDLNIVLLDKNYGTTYSRNIGLKQIKEDSDYICILDSDAQINEKALNILINCLEGIEGCGLVGPKLISPKLGVQLSGRHFPTLTIKIFKACPIHSIQLIGEKMEGYHNTADEDTYPVDYLMSACWLFKYSLLKEIGYLDEKIFYAPEDVEYCIRIWKNSQKVMFCSKAEIIHEWQRISKKKLFSRMNYEHIKGLIHLFRKYGYLLNAKKIMADGSLN